MKSSTLSKTKIAVSRTRQLLLKCIGIALIVFGAMAILASFLQTDKTDSEAAKSGAVTAAPTEAAITANANEKDNKENKRFDPVMCIVGAVLVGCGVLVVRAGNKEKKLVSVFKEYVRVLGNDPENSLFTITKQLNQPYDKVKSNVQKMIKKGFFANAKLDEENNKLLLGRKSAYDILDSKEDQAYSAPQAAVQKPAEEAKPIEIINVTCPTCGAKNRAPRGKRVECEYCGSDIQA